MNDDGPKSRIFLSCGQRGDAEKETAKKIGAMLTKKRFNFDVYLADLEHTNKELRHAVLGELEKSEYFLMIDFKREKLCGENEYRGSLFTHQELALATFLNIEQLRFAEKGVKLEGIAKLLQGRTIAFPDRKKLPELIAKNVKRQKWKSGWKNALRILPVKGRVHEEQVPRRSGGELIGNATF